MKKTPDDASLIGAERAASTQGEGVAVVHAFFRDEVIVKVDVLVVVSELLQRRVVGRGRLGGNQSGDAESGSSFERRAHLNW